MLTAFDRRLVLKGIGAAGLVGLMGGCSGKAEPAAAAQPFFERVGKPIGLQIYTLGDEIRADLGAAFAQVAQMGYGEIELPNLLGSTPAELKRLAEAAGLKIASMHVLASPLSPSPDPTFQGGTEAIADNAAALGITNVVIPIVGMPADFKPNEGEEPRAMIERALTTAGLDHWRAQAAMYNEWGAALKERGITLGYHNHNMEFAPIEGSNGWNILQAETDPELVKFQLDLGWVVTAGLDVVETINAVGSRLLSVHVKDVAADNKQAYWFGMSPAEVGSGTMDWKTILPAVNAAGAQHFFVEQEPPFAIPRIEAAEKGAAYLKALVA